jgi:RNA polymerase sigma-70 factor, ECF subfamily
MFNDVRMGVTDQDEAVRDAVTSGQQTWPGISLAPADFAAWVTARNIDPAALKARGSDLYLACGCARGDARALELFDRAFLHALRPSIARGALAPEQLDELRQRLRVRLLTGPEPRISTFAGHGPLAAWVRVAAVRLALELHASLRGAAESESALLDALVSADVDPELAAAKQQYRAEFTAALESILLGLSPREKTLLRMHFIDHLNIDEIGSVFRVHRATVARWLVAIRRQLFQQLCGRLSLQLRSSASSVASLVRLVRSDVELSIQRLLRD